MHYTHKKYKTLIDSDVMKEMRMLQQMYCEEVKIHAIFIDFCKVFDDYHRKTGRDDDRKKTHKMIYHEYIGLKLHSDQ